MLTQQSTTHETARTLSHVRQNFDQYLAAVGGCSLVVPIRVADLSCLSDFNEHYHRLIEQMRFVQHWELLFVNASSEALFATVDAWFTDIDRASIRHIRPGIQNIDGHNNKLLAIREALSLARFRYVLLLDHDMRPSREALEALVPHIQQYDCARCMIHYPSFHLKELINLNGIFLINLFCRDKQFWGHLLLNREVLLTLGFPRTDVLFDELTITRHFQRHHKRVGYFSTIALTISASDSPTRFWEQRLRYAYENLAYPLRFTAFLSLLPLLGLCMYISSLLAVLVLTAITLGTIGFACIGQICYARATCPWYTFLLAPFWFWLYPFTSWIALSFLLTGGIKFGGQRIHRPA